MEALGFTRRQALEAFFACDRNEELAANYLFDRMHDGGDLEEEEHPEDDDPDHDHDPDQDHDDYEDADH